MTARHLTSALERAAQANGKRIALSGQGSQLTYQQFFARARAVAQALGCAGVRDDVTVMLQCSNHPLDFVAFLGVWLAGSVVVPVHRSSP